MKDDAKEQLNRILGAYDEKLAETERREAAIRAAKAAFPGRFAALTKDVILPVLQELAALLTARGHGATAREQEESSSTGGGVLSAAAEIRIVPKTSAGKAAESTRSFIEITFSANRSEQKVVVSSTNTIISSRASVGKRGEYEIEALTADVVADHVLRALEQAFAAAT